jgi:hypothetical protein
VEALVRSIKEVPRARSGSEVRNMTSERVEWGGDGCRAVGEEATGRLKPLQSHIKTNASLLAKT